MRYCNMRYLIILTVAILSGLKAAAVLTSDFDKIVLKYQNMSNEMLSDEGKAFLARNSMDSAMSVYTIMAAKNADPQTIEARFYACEAHNCLGMICFMNSNYTGAYSHFKAASEIQGNEDAAGNLNLSAIYLYYGDQQKAYHLMRNVFDDAIKKHNYHIASSTLLNLLSAEIDESILPPDTIARLIRHYQSHVRRTTDNPEYELAAHMAAAKLSCIEGRFDRAIDELHKSVKTNRGTLVPSRNLFSSYEEMGKTFMAAGNTDSAIFYFNKAVDIARANNYPELLISAYANISRMYSAVGETSLAEEYRFKRLNLNDSLFTTREFGEIHDLEMFHQADKLENHLNRISMEKELREKVLWVVSSALLLLAALLVFIFRQNRSLQRKNRYLFDRNLEIMDAQEKGININQDVPETENATINDSNNAEIIPVDSETAQNDHLKYTSSGLSEEAAAALEKRILEVMRNESIFCKQDFSLRDLAQLCDSNSKYVSQVMNERIGMSFSQYLNECRVSVARRLFVDKDNYGHLTIEGIVAELGYKSRSTFSKTFKRITGLSPSEFQRMANDEKRNVYK